MSLEEFDLKLWAAAAALLLTLLYRTLKHKDTLPSLPGPRGWPIVGNLLQVGKDAGQTYYEWSKEFGEVYKIRLGERDVVVVNSAKAATQLFNEQGSTYISRPLFYTFHKLVSSTAGFTIGTSPWDESCKKKRKAAATPLNRPAVQSYVPIIDAEVHGVIEDIFKKSPEGDTAIDPYSYLQRFALNTSLVVNYGTRLADVEDSMFKEIIEVETLVANFRSVSGTLADYVPLLRWLPGSKVSKEAGETRRRRDVYMTHLLDGLKDRIRKGTDVPCITGNILKLNEVQLTDLELSSICLSMVSAGLDTLANTLIWSVGYLATRPDIQQKAYDEISKVYKGQPPDSYVEDIEYITALHKECSRFFTVLKLALPRSTIGDSSWNGHFIPDGTTVFLNAWGVHHDPERYPQPWEFQPERYLDQKDTRQAHYAFGAGRRMCAGVYLANRELYIAFSKLIHFFKIDKSLVPSEQDFDINPATACSNPRGLSSAPHPFKIRFVPRDRAQLESWLAEEGRKVATHN